MKKRKFIDELLMANAVAFQNQQAFRYSLICTTPGLVLVAGVLRNIREYYRASPIELGIIMISLLIITHLLLKKRAKKILSDLLKK